MRGWDRGVAGMHSDRGDDAVMSTADEHRPPLRDSAKSSSRADQIRQRVAVLSSSFRTLYLEWFARLSAQDFDEGDVAAILDAAEAELAGL